MQVIIRLKLPILAKINLKEFLPPPPPPMNITNKTGNQYLTLWGLLILFLFFFSACAEDSHGPTPHTRPRLHSAHDS